MTAGPEIARLINEFETDSQHLKTKQYKHTLSIQVKYCSNVKQPAVVIEHNMGNPSRESMDSLQRIEGLEKQIYNTFVH